MDKEQQPWLLNDKEVETSVRAYLGQYSADELRDMLQQPIANYPNNFTEELEGKNISSEKFREILNRISPPTRG